MDGPLPKPIIYTNFFIVSIFVSYKVCRKITTFKVFPILKKDILLPKKAWVPLGSECICICKGLSSRKVDLVS